MKIFPLLLLVPIMAFASATPKDIRASIHKYGSNSFSSKITAEDWAEAIKKISKGDDEWLLLVPDLAPVVNLQQSNQLSGALYYALDANAKEALTVMSILDKHHYKHQQGTDIACVPPFDKITNSGMAIYNRIRLSLLDAGPQAATCLWIMEAWVEEIKANEARKSS
ncbi:hypothetical protein EDF78_10964 [Rahnella sp. BIGb0236]|uniref:hypothetical protein n=1 Tax=Rahnella sp. BIGb0236 TaxID=2485117 RepID=UPI001061EA00|nr:hypothetical protein [Rahnella sp. BIGb0236]TDS88868.1 hypothetical protein EDF78_10964 [Rahnella sp. BIGb0236]